MGGRAGGPTDSRDGAEPVTFHTGVRLEARGQLAGAVEAYRAVLARRPSSVEALRRLSSLLQVMGRLDERREVLRSLHRLEVGQAPASDEDREAFVDFAVAAALGDTAPDRPPREYVSWHFDDYAEQFDQHLVDRLGYSGHLEIRKAVMELFRPSEGSLDVLDLGCGTGLVGDAMEQFARTMDGVDLSPKMVAVARRRGVYRDLTVGDVVDTMASTHRTYDLVTASDVFTYIGDLGPAFEQMGRVLRDGGHGVLTLERHEGSQPFVLGITRRYGHSIGYLHDATRGAGLTALPHRSFVMRTQNRRPVASVLWAFRRGP